MTCHMHPGTNMVTTYYGYTWWENETDGKHDVPGGARKRERSASARRCAARNPEGSGAARALGRRRRSSRRSARPSSTRSSSTRSSPTSTATAGSTARSTSAIGSGNLLDADDKVVPHDDPEKFGKAVHLKDIHLEKGMQCVDCHFGQDNHGNGKLYGETRNAVEIDCVDCHGTVDEARDAHHQRPGRRPQGGTALAALRTPFARAALRLGRRAPVPALDDGRRT